LRLGIKISLVIGILLILGFVAWFFYPKPIVYDESFEHDFGGWTEDAQVPMDPNNPGHPVAWEVSRTTSMSYSGQYSLELHVDGRQDDGTVWIEKKIAVKNNSPIQVTVSFEFYSEQESFNVIAGVCASARLSDPEVEEDFIVLGPANEVAGWNGYTYATTLHTGTRGELWVALGITVRWETEMAYNIDNVRVTIA
jgi:hypothetical protein